MNPLSQQPSYKPASQSEYGHKLEEVNSEQM